MSDENETSRTPRPNLNSGEDYGVPSHAQIARALTTPLSPAQLVDKAAGMSPHLQRELSKGLQASIERSKQGPQSPGSERVRQQQGIAALILGAMAMDDEESPKGKTGRGGR